MEPGKIRNVAVVGHRGVGKTSLIEAMLFEAGAVNRLGTIEAASTTTDWDADEQRRQMSLQASLAHLEWQGRKINLIDTPGDPGFQGDAIAALKVVEGAIVVVSAVMGVEVGTAARLEARRLGRRRARHLREHARPGARRLLPRAGGDPGAAVRPRGRRAPADRPRARADRDRRPPPHVRLRQPRGRARGQGRRDPGRAGRPGRRVPREAARRGRRDRRGADGALSRGPGARRGRRGARAQGRGHARRGLPGRVRRRHEEPRHDRAARPARRGRPEPGEEGLADRARGPPDGGVRLQDDRRPVRGQDQRLPRRQGTRLVRL